MENTSKFTGFEPTQENQEAINDINARIQSILDEAPSDASARIFIRKVKSGYKGLLKIYSQQRRFVGGAMEVRLGDLVEDLFKDVRHQIKDWKARRFSHDSV